MEDVPQLQQSIDYLRSSVALGLAAPSIPQAHDFGNVDKEAAQFLELEGVPEPLERG